MFKLSQIKPFIIQAVSGRFYFKTSMVDKKTAKWLLNQKWLWMKTKIELVSYCSQDIDIRVEKVDGYKHFIFRGCIACEKFEKSKEYLLKSWFQRYAW